MAHTQSLLLSAISTDAVGGWHNPFVLFRGGITTQETITQNLSVTGPPPAEIPFSSTYSGVFDNGVHITGTSATPVIAKNPVMIGYDMVANPAQNEWGATVAYVKSRAGSIVTSVLPVLGVYNVEDPNTDPPNFGADPPAVAEDRIITFKVSGGTSTTNNIIWILDGSGTWIQTGEVKNGVLVAVIRTADFFTENDTLIYSAALDTGGINQEFRWTKWYLEFDHDYLTNSGYNVRTGVGLRHATINSWLDQSVKTTANPTFVGMELISYGTNVFHIERPNSVDSRYSFLTWGGEYYVQTFDFPGPLTASLWMIEILVCGICDADTFSNYQKYTVLFRNPLSPLIVPMNSNLNKTGVFTSASAVFEITTVPTVTITVGGTDPLAYLATWSLKITGLRNYSS